MTKPIKLTLEIPPKEINTILKLKKALALYSLAVDYINQGNRLVILDAEGNIKNEIVGVK